ncbi:MAG: acyl-CoA dehydrogenase family protein [Deltaproteobacteria bacterium]
MKFALSQEHDLLQEMVRSLIEKECPAARRHAIADGDAGFDPAHWRALGELGLAGLMTPAEFGGTGLGLLELALVAESLGEGALPGPFLGHALASLALTLGGSPSQKKAWLPRLATGEALATIAFAEADDIWQPEEWRLAFASGRLSGTKRLVPQAQLADLIVVGVAGGGLVLIERSAAGISLAPFDGVDGTRRLDTLTLDGVCGEALPDGAEAARRVRDAGLVLLAADAFGGAWRLLRDTIAYLDTRVQFGRRLSEFQGIKHQLANLATGLEPSRALLWYAAHAFDQEEADAPRLAAIAKAHITDRAMEIAREAVELHGGIGFTWECGVHLWYKRAMFDRAFLGLPGAQRERSADLAGW